MNSAIKKPKVYLSIIGVVVIIVVIVLVLALGGAAPGKGATTTTTVAPVRTHTTAQQAVIASLSVARAALYENTNAKAKVDAHDITLAAAPDKGTLVIVKNLGQIKTSPQMVAFQWDFGGAPILTCVNVPSTRSGTATEATCPANVSTVAVTTTTLKHHHSTVTTLKHTSKTTTTLASVTSTTKPKK